MSSTMRLKDEARRFEQTEDWDRAIELYRRALEEEAGDGELGLYNRIGDLYLRLGDTASAVGYYVQAANRYADAGFLNNAIALCNKALRYEPERVPLYEKLGRLCAEQGFLTDARRWFLEYAERLAGAGQMDASLGALKEFAELSQDADVWAQLGRQYAAQGRSEDALRSFERAVSAYVDGGQGDRAGEVANEARQLDPSFAPAGAGPTTGVDTDAGADAARAAIDENQRAHTDDDGILHPGEPDAPGRDAIDPGPVTVSADAEDVYEADLVDFGGPWADARDQPGGGAASATDELPPVAPLDLDSPALDPLPDVAEDEEYTTLSVESLLREEPAYREALGEVDAPAAPGAEDDEDDEPLPLLAGDDGPMPMPEWTDVVDPQAPAGPDPEVASPIVAGEDDAPRDVFESGPVDAVPDDTDGARTVPVAVDDALELVDIFDADEAVEEGVAAPYSEDLLDDLPTLGEASDEKEAAGLHGAPPAGGGVFGTPDAPSGASFADGIPEEFVAPRTPEDRARAMISEGRVDDALDVLEHAAGAAEEREATHESLRLAALMVELAPRSVRALRLRAGAVERAGDARQLAPALAALADRLRDSGDAEAARGYYERVLAADPDHAGARAALTEVASPAAGDDYVDLAALVGDVPLETTRFVVEEEVPTGDEDQDFHEMLSQFRSKVSEHVSVEDTASHYDLGIAFKEMGLIDEAIAEFQTALRFGSARLKVYEELGQCFMEKGDFAIAEKLLRQGTNEMATDPSELLGVNYHLGRCYEELRRPDDAREAYERVLSLDIDFRDVSDRLERL